MKLLSMVLLGCTAWILTAEAQTEASKDPTPPAGGNDTHVYKKLGAVTWDPDARKLEWTVETGQLVDGKFVSNSKDRYEISPQEATMGNSGQKRSFDTDEAAQLHQLLLVLTLYCAESSVWWDQGSGDPVDESQKPVKVNERPAPIRIPPGQAIAMLQKVR